MRRGAVGSGATPWTGAHERWLRSQPFDALAVQLAFDSSVEAMLLSRRQSASAAGLEPSHAVSPGGTQTSLRPGGRLLMCGRMLDQRPLPDAAPWNRGHLNETQS